MRKQHSRYKAMLSSIVLSQQSCEVYFIPLTVAKPLWDLTAKYPPNITGWIHLPSIDTYFQYAIVLCPVPVEKISVCRTVIRTWSIFRNYACFRIPNKLKHVLSASTFAVLKNVWKNKVQHHFLKILGHGIRYLGI